MSAPFMHPHRIANCTRDWSAIGSYSVRVSDDRYDPIEALRQSIREREEKRSDHIGTVLFVLTVVVSYCLLASAAL